VTSFGERFSGVRWRLRATRRLWSAGVQPNMPILPPGPLAVTARGLLDAPEADSALDRDALHARGWVLFSSGPATRVELWLGDHPLGRARVGVPRPDIERLADDPLAGVSGFEITADLSRWKPGLGEIAIRTVATGSSGERYELPPVPVKPAASGEEAGASMPLPAAQPPRPPGKGGLRVLVCTHQLNLGGAQLYLLDLLRELVRQGAVEPAVVSSADGVLREELEAIGIPVHISSLVPPDDLSSHVGRVEELFAWASERGFEAVFVNTATAFSFPGAELAAELGVPAVWAIHESFPPAVLWSELDPQVRRRAEKALSGAAVALFEADATRRLFEPSIGAGRSLVVPYGLDLRPIEAARADFDRAAARREAGIAEDAEVVLCVGTVEPRKAQLPLAQAFGSIAADHPRARLVFVGGRDDVYSDALSAFVESNGLDDRIDLIPVTPDILPWYGLADLLVCASDIESLPRTVLEAMAFETPVLATSVFGLPELIDDGETGWLCEPRDTLALASALDRALNSSPEERRRIGRAARALVIRRHPLDAYGREVARLLKDAVSGKAPDTSHATAS
jgi:glycosyltransferase involved in cell wall biosynthesis